MQTDLYDLPISTQSDAAATAYRLGQHRLLGAEARIVEAFEDCIAHDPGFALGSFFPAPASQQEAELCRSYLKQLREEIGRRLVAKVYDADGQPSKFWTVFAKRKFMNKAL